MRSLFEVGGQPVDAVIMPLLENHSFNGVEVLSLLILEVN